MRSSTFSRVVKIGLYFYGVWPYTPFTLPFRLYWIAALSTAQVFQYGYVYANIDNDNFSEFMDGLSSAMASTLLFLKLILLWVNQRTFSEILQMMAADWRDYTLRQYDRSVMTKTALLARRTSRVIILMQTASVVFYSFGVLAANAGDPDKWEPQARELILKMKFPFNISTHPIYVSVTIIQFYHLLLVGWGITIVNSLLVTLIFHIGGQIDILRKWLTEAFSKNEMASAEEIALRSLLVKHQQVIRFAENIENLYTYIALMMLLSDTLIICCIGYIIVTSISEPNAAAILVKSIMFYITMNLDVFIYCYSGEYLSGKSALIGEASYNSLWYEAPTKESRMMSLVILRSQKQLMITSGKVMELSLERFTSVVKASASYMSVLLAMH